MTNAFSWQNSANFDLLLFVLLGQICLLPKVSLDFLLLHSSPLYRKGHLFWVFQKILQVFIEVFNFSFFSITGQGTDLEFCDIEQFAWKCTEIILLFLRLHPNTAFQTLLLARMATPFLLKDSCPQQQIQWSSELFHCKVNQS